jgi:hypothetical protein
MFLITYQGVASFDSKTDSYGFDLMPNPQGMEQFNPEVMETPESPAPVYQPVN